MHMSVQNVSIISNTSSNKSNISGVGHSNKQRANFKTNYIDDNNNDKNEKYNYGCGDNNNSSKNIKNNNDNKCKERVAHHRNSYDSSSFNNKVTTTNTTTKNTTTPITNKTNNNNNNNNNNNSNKNNHNKAIPIKIPIKKTYKNNLPASNCCNNININKATSINLSPNLANSKTRDNLIEQFENLKSKAEYFADKDPDFTSRLLNFANKISKAHQLHSAGDLFTTCGMESSYYSNAYSNHHHTRYSHPSIYSSHSTYHTQPSNIYSTFNSTVFYNNHHNNTSHHRTHQAPPPPPPPPQCSSSAPSSPQPSTASSQPQQSTSSQQNASQTNGSSSRSSNSKNHDSSNFKRYSTNSTSHSKNYKDDHGYGRYNAYNTYPNHHYSSTNSSSRYNDPSSFHNNIYASHYYQHYSQSEHTPFIYSYHNQDGPEDIFLILEDTYDPNKLIVQMTRTHLGPNGEQQRVTVERDFRNEMELNAFLKEFEENLHKTSKSHNSHQTNNNCSKVNRSTSDDYIKSPGVVVVEEPGEEPKLYRQDTGELVTPTNSSYIDPVLHEENDEHPNELPKGKEKAKYPSSHSKLYKDIDELIENLITEDQNLKSKTFQVKQDKDNTSSASIYSKQQQKEKEKIQKRYSFPPRDDTKDQQSSFKKSFHQTSHFESKSSPVTDPKIFFSSSEPKRSNETFSSSKSEKLNKETSKPTDLLSDNSSTKNNSNSKSSELNSTTNNHSLNTNSSTISSTSSKKQNESISQRLIMSNHKLNKKDNYANTTTVNCHRSSSTRSVNRKIKFRTLNEKDLKKSNRLPEKLKKTLKDSPLLSKSPTNGGGGSHRIYSGKENKEKLFSSKLKSHDSESYSHNRVSFSFQPTTEYLQHFRNVGLTKLGAASSLKSKDVPIYQRAHLPRSQSVITCHQNLSDTNDFICKLDELNELDSKENNENIRYSQHYAKFDSDSNNTTVEETTTTTTTTNSFKEKEVSIKSISDIKKTYKKIKNSLNVPKNISKSVEMISKKTTSDLKKNLDPKKNLAKINEYFSPNNQLGTSKSNKKLNEQQRQQQTKNIEKNSIKIIKPTPLTPPTVVASKIDKTLKQEDELISSKKKSFSDKVKKKTIKISEKNNKYSARDEFPDIDDSDADDDDEQLITDNNSNSKIDSKLNEKDDYDINETDEYEEDDSEDQTSYDYYKSYNNNDKNNYHYDTSNLYSRQSDIYNSYRSHPSPAFFQPGFYPRSNAPQPDLIQSSNSQNLFSQQQHHHHHMQYHQSYFSKQSSYYGSWYGSTPSLRVPVRNQNRQSSYFN